MENENRPVSVKVNGKSTAIHTCRVSKMPFNTIWPGHQRSLDQTENAYFVSFDGEGEADIELLLENAPQKVTVRPRRHDITATTDGCKVRFKIHANGQYVLEADGRHNAFCVFSNPAEVLGGAGADYYFGPGEHDAGRIRLKSNEKVYVSEGAVVYGEFFAEDAENVSFYGRGIIDGSKALRDGSRCRIGHDGIFNFTRCKNVSINGVILRDSRLFTVTTINCDGVKIENVKVIGNWRYNSDGFDFVNSKNVHVRGCFLRTFDDTVVIKGLRLSEDREIEKISPENHVIEDCVLWCDWGGALEIGAETVADEFKNITYRNIDIVKTDQGAMRIHSGDRAEIHDVSYENVSVEYAAYDTPPLYQHTEDMPYEPGPEPASLPFIKAWMYCGRWSDDNILGHVHDISYDNVRLFVDNGVKIPKIALDGADSDHRIENVSVRNVTVNGKPAKPEAELNAFVTGLEI